MINLRSVSIRGVFNYARARLLWSDGLMRVYTPDGLVLELISDQPVRRPGYVHTWDVKTSKGNIEVRGKCITCGGKKWWRVAFAPSEELWRTAW
jgi:hypothetical protein